MTHSTTALAHPNIALIKYWGKSNSDLNLPSTPSLSITLSKLTTRTTISTSEIDVLYINGKSVQDEKISQFLNSLRQTHSVKNIRIETENNFPTSAGLASSAAGFAALTMALNTHFSLGFSKRKISSIARTGSASAARSIHGGFVGLQGPDWEAEPIVKRDYWPLRIVIATINIEKKKTGSSKGMEITRFTSPFYQSWVNEAQKDFDEALTAIKNRDFDKLADLSEKNCLKMIATMISSNPPLIYWAPATLACIQLIRELRTSGQAVFFTTDAGPQVKAICLPESEAKVIEALASVVGSKNITSCEIGDEAEIIQN